MAYAPTDVCDPVIGRFTECDHGNVFEYGDNDVVVVAPPAHGGKNILFPHKVWVGPLGEYRAAKVMKTCVHIITKETQIGSIVERWSIKNHKKYN